MDYYRDIFWDKIHNNEKVKEAFIDELVRLGVKIDANNNFDTNLALRTFDQAISGYKSVVHKRIHKLVNPNNLPTISIPLYKVVFRGSAGYSFGELALLKNEGRAATIVCEKDCIFATLDRKEYNRIIGQ